MWLNGKQEHELVTGQLIFRKLCNKPLKIISHATLWETLGLKWGGGGIVSRRPLVQLQIYKFNILNNVVLYVYCTNAFS